MQANKKTGAGGALLLFSILAIGTLIFFWRKDQGLGLSFKWGKPDPLAQSLELIRTRYVDEISSDSLQGLSMDSLIGRLDPHSAYLSPSTLKVANEDLAGHFAGIGVEFIQIRDTITVAFLMPNSPSAEAGIQVGDQLLAIGNRSLVGKSVSDDSVRSWVRGPVGSVADLTIRSQGRIKKISIKRSDIPTPAVSAWYLLNDTTGFIKLSKFSQGSYRETVQALEALNEKGIKALVLDLRSNGGGFMHEAVELADEFLSDDRLIVYTDGAHQKKRSYSCKRPGLFETGKLTILMNEFSASASEVLAGALQDWCRATIIGRKSFGKGLVQEQYDLSNGGALRLTVARYYTPLGRCIQRPYNGEVHTYLQAHDEQEKHSFSSAIKRYLNNCGDTLFSGGGILPNIYIPKKEQLFSKSYQEIMNSPEFALWAYRYFQQHKKEMEHIKDFTNPALAPPLSSIRSFFEQQTSKNLSSIKDINESEWKWIGFNLFALIARYSKGNTEYVRVLHLNDPFVQEALSPFTNSKD